eukprot:gene61929-biopygen33725
MSPQPIPQLIRHISPLECHPLFRLELPPKNLQDNPQDSRPVIPLVNPLRNLHPNLRDNHQNIPQVNLLPNRLSNPQDSHLVILQVNPQHNPLLNRQHSPRVSPPVSPLDSQLNILPINQPLSLPDSPQELQPASHRRGRRDSPRPNRLDNLQDNPVNDLLVVLWVIRLDNPQQFPTVILPVHQQTAPMHDHRDSRVASRQHSRLIVPMAIPRNHPQDILPVNQLVTLPVNHPVIHHIDRVVNHHRGLFLTLREDRRHNPQDSLLDTPADNLQANQQDNPVHSQRDSLLAGLLIIHHPSPVASPPVDRWRTRPISPALSPQVNRQHNLQVHQLLLRQSMHNK